MSGISWGIAAESEPVSIELSDSGVGVWGIYGVLDLDSMVEAL